MIFPQMFRMENPSIDPSKFRNMADVTDSIAAPTSGAPDDKAMWGCGWYMSLGPTKCC